MRLAVIAKILLLIPLALGSPIALEQSFTLPTLDNVESHLNNLWDNFKKGYGVFYNTTAEEFHRFQIFAGHIKLIVKHNLEHDLGLHTYRLGVNRFAAMVKRN